MKRLAALLLALPAATAIAAPVALSDDDLAGISGQDGIGLAVHLELNSSLLAGVPSDSRLTLGFKVDGVTTYAVLDNLAGVVDLFALTLDVRSRPDGGGDYLDIDLPGFVGFKQFGFRALAAQTDPSAPIAPSASYGQLLINGTGAMTGRVYLWGQQ